MRRQQQQQTKNEDGRIPFAPSSQRLQRASSAQVREVASRYNSGTHATPAANHRLAARGMGTSLDLGRPLSAEKRRNLADKRSNGLWPSSANNAAAAAAAAATEGKGKSKDSGKPSDGSCKIRKKDQTENEKPRENIILVASKAGNKLSKTMSMSKSVHLSPSPVPSSSTQANKQQEKRGPPTLRNLTQSLNGRIEVQRWSSSSELNKNACATQRKPVKNERGQQTPSSNKSSARNAKTCEQNQNPPTILLAGEAAAARRPPALVIRPQSPLRSPSPAKVTSPSRALPSPPRSRPSSSHGSRPSSPISFSNDIFKTRRTSLEQEDAHSLKILHNRYLQWRFVNARAEEAHKAKQATAQRLVFNAWAHIFNLRTSVAMHQIKLHKFKEHRKLVSILKSHGRGLEEWCRHEMEYSAAVSGMIVALNAAVLRVPLSSGAKGDSRTVSEALGLASSVMALVNASVCKLLPKTEEQRQLLHELAQTAAQEKALIEECSHLLARLASLEIEERSLRIHSIQLRHEH